MVVMVVSCPVCGTQEGLTDAGRIYSERYDHLATDGNRNVTKRRVSYLTALRCGTCGRTFTTAGSAPVEIDDDLIQARMAVEVVANQAVRSAD